MKILLALDFKINCTNLEQCFQCHMKEKEFEWEQTSYQHLQNSHLKNKVESCLHVSELLTYGVSNAFEENVRAN